MNIKLPLLVFCLLVSVASVSGNSAFFMKLAFKMLGSVFKMDSKFLGPIAMQGLKTFTGMLAGGGGGAGGLASEAMGVASGLIGTLFGGAEDVIEDAGGAIKGKVPDNLGAKAGGMFDSLVKNMTHGGAQLFSSVFSMVKNIFGEWASLAWGVVTFKKGLPDMVETVVQVGLESFFKIFAYLTIETQTQIASVFAESFNVLNTVLKLHLGPIETLKAVLPAEIKIIKAAMEKGWTTANTLIASLGSRTPVTARIVAPSFHAMQNEWTKRRRALPVEANHSLTKMIGGLKDAQSKIGKAVAATPPQQRKELGVLYNVIKNFHMLSYKLL